MQHKCKYFSTEKVQITAKHKTLLPSINEKVESFNSKKHGVSLTGRKYVTGWPVKSDGALDVGRLESLGNDGGLEESGEVV